MRILAFDIGNTQIKMGVFDNDDLICSWRLMTSNHTTDEFGIDIQMLLRSENMEVSSLDRVAISSVVPDIMHSFVNAVRRYLKKEPLLIGPGVKTGVKIKAANPKEVGADLIADVAAATELYGFPAIIVDFGTVTKYEVVNENGEFMAAVLAPGIGISAQAMSERAAQLPSIAIRKPEHILTSDTVECMQVGVVYGYIGQVSYMVDLIKRELKNPDMKVIATGGFGNVLAGELPCVNVYDRALTLEGIKIIASRNKAPRLQQISPDN